MAQPYLCPTHQTEQDSWCERCLMDFEQRQPANDMTGDERAAALDRLGRVVTMPFDKIHQRIEELVGRSVWTHEMGGEKAWSMLLDEARTRDHPSFGEILDKIPGDKSVIIVKAD